MLLHVPPQEGMLFFPRDSRTERAHTHTNSLLPPISSFLFFFFFLFSPLILSLSLAATLFYFGSPQMSTKIDSLGPCTAHHCWGGEIKKRSSSHWDMKEKRREIWCFWTLLHEEEGEVGRPKKLSRGRAVKECWIGPLQPTKRCIALA